MNIKTLFIAGSLITGIATADTTLVYNDKNGEEQSRMLLTDGKVKMVSKAESDTAMIFDATTNSFTIINHQDKSYMVFGEKEIEALSDVSKMMDRMIDEQLSQLPAAQREQMRGMMESMIKKQMPKQLPAPKYIKSGETATYNGFNCEVVVKETKGKKDGEFCVASYSKLGISDAEYGAVAHFMKVAEKMASQFGQDQSMNFEAIGEVVPVYFDMSSQKGYLTSVNDEDLPSATFAVPSGYKQESLPKELF
jgi:gas vesicle protein